MVSVTLCSVASVLSYGAWSDYRLAGKNFNEIAAIPEQILLPLGGLLIAAFAGWFMLRSHSEDELRTNDATYTVWRVLVRYLAVPAIAVILVSGLF